MSILFILQWILVVLQTITVNSFVLFSVITAQTIDVFCGYLRGVITLSLSCRQRQRRPQLYVFTLAV